MEFCKLVFCYNDDIETLNEAEKLPRTNNCHSRSCQSVGNVSRIDEKCACICGNNSSKSLDEGCTCIGETNNEFTSKVTQVDQATITDKTHGFYCICESENNVPKREARLLQIDKTETDEAHVCVCPSKYAKSNNMAKIDSQGQYPNPVSCEPNTHYSQSVGSFLYCRSKLSSEPYICINRIEPCSCNCLCLDGKQTPTKESRILKDKELSAAVDNNCTSIVCTDSKNTNGMLQNFTDGKCLSKAHLVEKYTNTRKKRHVCFCPELDDLENTLHKYRTTKISKNQSRDANRSFEDYSASAHKSHSLNETTRFLIGESTETSTQSTVETSSRTPQIVKSADARKVTYAKNSQILETFSASPASRETQRRILVKPVTTHTHRNCLKSLNSVSIGSPEYSKLSKSSQTKKMSYKMYLTTSIDDLMKASSPFLTKAADQLPKRSLTDSAGSTKTSITQTVTKKEQVASTICACCQAVCRSPSAPCVTVSKITPIQSRSVKSVGTHIETVEPVEVAKADRNKNHYIVQKEKAKEDEADKEKTSGENIKDNERVKNTNDDNFCDLQEVIAKYDKITNKIRNQRKPIRKREVCKEIFVTKEDIDIIDEYFKDRDEDEEDAKYGSFKYHYLMKDMPCATVEAKEVNSQKSNGGESKYNFLMFDGGTRRTSPKQISADIKSLLSSRESRDSTKWSKRESWRMEHQLEQVPEKIPHELDVLHTHEVRSMGSDLDKRKEVLSDLSENISINDHLRVNALRRGSYHPEEFVKMDLPDEEKEVKLTDATWIGPNQEFASNLETYGGLEKMVRDQLRPEEPVHLYSNKEPISVFEEILKEEKRKFTRSSMASQQSAQSKVRDRGSSRFFDFFRGWRTQKKDLKRRNGNGRARKSIIIRESDEEIITQSPSDTSLTNYEEEEADGIKRSSINAYRARPFPNVASRQPEGTYSGSS